MRSSVTNKGLQWALCGLLGVAAAPLALAQSPAEGLLNNSWVFNAGGFIVGSELKANLNGQSTNNPEVDFDESFGNAEDGTRARVDVLWRINPRHHLRFMYFDNSNKTSKVLADDVQWGDYTFLAGSAATGERKFKVYELAYEYAFMRSPTYEVAASIGLHATDMLLKVTGTVNVLDNNGNVVRQETASKAGDALAPLPVIGIRGAWVVAPQWYIDAQAQLFSLNYGEYGGNWSDLRVGATWMFHNNFGVGLGFNRFTSKVEVDKSDFDGKVKLGYSGILAYLTGTF